MSPKTVGKKRSPTEETRDDNKVFVSLGGCKDFFVYNFIKYTNKPIGRWKNGKRKNN